MQENTVRPGGSLRAWLALALAMGVLYIPFLGRAYHIDEPAYVHLATLYEWNPLEAHPSDYPYLGVSLEGMYPYESTHPFLVPYSVRAAKIFFGDSETAVHASFLLFAIIALVSLATLAREFFPENSGGGVLLAGLFATTPVFLLSSQSVMTDVPSLAFTLAAAALYVRAIARRGLGRWLLAGAAMLAALCCSYQSVLLMPLLLVFAWRRGQLDRSVFAGLALPATLFGLWLGAIWIQYDVFIFKSARPDSGFSAKEEIARATGVAGSRWLVLAHKGVHILAVWGLALAFLLPLRARVRGRARSLAVQLLVLAPVVGFALQYVPVPEAAHGSYAFGDRVLLAVLVALGLIGAGSAIAELRGRSAAAPQLLLVGVIAAFGLFAWVLLPFSAARYQLPVVAAFWLILGGALDGRVLWNRHRVALVATLVGSGALGLVCAVADARHANVYRDFARGIAEEVAGSEELGSVFFIGEWGLRHYMLSEGGNYLLRDSTEPQTGDLIVQTAMHERFWYPPGGYGSRVEPHAEHAEADRWPVRMFHQDKPAGFYSSGYGLLPLTVVTRPTPYEVFKVWHVAR